MERKGPPEPSIRQDGDGGLRAEMERHKLTQLSCVSRPRLNIMWGAILAGQVKKSRRGGRQRRKQISSPSFHLWGMRNTQIGLL